MTRKFGKFAILAGAILAAGPVTVKAQDFFREYGTSRSSGGIGPVTPTDYTYQDAAPLSPLDPNNVNEGRTEPNFAIGPIRFSIAVGVGVEFNDNIFLSENHRESDIVIRPNLSVEASWQITERNVLRFSMGVGYAKYLDHSELDTDGVLFSPNSAIEMTFGLGEAITVSLRDR